MHFATLCKAPVEAFPMLRHSDHFFSVSCLTYVSNQGYVYVAVLPVRVFSSQSSVLFTTAGTWRLWKFSSLPLANLVENVQQMQKIWGRNERWILRQGIFANPCRQICIHVHLHRHTITARLCNQVSLFFFLSFFFLRNAAEVLDCQHAS